MAEAWGVHMGACDCEALARNHVEHAQARSARKIRVKVVFHCCVRVRDLDRGEMHQIAPGYECITPGADAPAGMTGRVTGCQHGRAAERFLAVAHAPDA